LFMHGRFSVNVSDARPSLLRTRLPTLCRSEELFAMSIECKPSHLEQVQGELLALATWTAKAQKIDTALARTKRQLGNRDEKLEELRSEFETLTSDFWNEFARHLGCDNPARTIASLEKRTFRNNLTLHGRLLIANLVGFIFALLWWQTTGYSPDFITVIVSIGAPSVALLGIWAVTCPPPERLAQARRVAQMLEKNRREPLWLSGGLLAINNSTITPPPGSRLWTPDRITYVFIRDSKPRFTIDALSTELIWEDPANSTSEIYSDPLLRDGGLLNGRTATEILKHLVATNQRYRQLGKRFSAIASLETELSVLESLKAEANIGRKAELTRENEEKFSRSEALRSALEKEGVLITEKPRNAEADKKASWKTLIIPQSLRENLQAYCRILRDYEAYRAAGVHLPKGLLFHGPPGCGKTQIAKTLSAEGGLNFVALSTSDCKQMWIGWSADRLATVFKEARSKQPSLIFIDELDAVCPPRGAYHDSISQEFTAQLLQEIDGLLSDTQAIFLVGATNRPDQVDSAILSRFAEQIEIPLPDATTRVALLTLFLGPLAFSGDKTRIIRRLALDTAGKSGRDLRAIVNQAVLAAVKRTNSPKELALFESDFPGTKRDEKDEREIIS
jgi:SpoVK/Ycf46/Vps4 family AAA+-type ATPase